MTASGCKYTEIKKAAEGLDCELVQVLYAKNPDVHMLNMAIVGAGNVMEELIESPQFQQDQQSISKDMKIRAQECQKICDWAVANGGSWIFYTKSSLRTPTAKRGESFFSRVEDVKGSRGSQKGSIQNHHQLVTKQHECLIDRCLFGIILNVSEILINRMITRRLVRTDLIREIIR